MQIDAAVFYSIQGLNLFKLFPIANRYKSNDAQVFVNIASSTEGETGTQIFSVSPIPAQREVLVISL